MKRVAILGSGFIGCDLLVKCLREPGLEVVGFAGQHANSKGLAFGQSKGVPTSDQSIDGLINGKLRPDIIVDCTSAASHPDHYRRCLRNRIKIIDMTPAKLGVACCPAINLPQCIDASNINMISCGGQASLPICFAIKESNPAVDYIEVVSTVASASVGPGTRKNISEYIQTTQKAIEQMININKAKVMVNISPATPPLMMRTSIIVEAASIASIQETAENIEKLVNKARQYIPGYQTTVKLNKIGPKAMCQVMVSGCGDYLPEYAGNLDIINCAALEVIKSL